MKTSSLFIVLFLFLAFSHSSQSQTLWTPTNGPNEGWVHSIAFRGDDAFLATDVGGLFHSTDHGMNWHTTPLDTVSFNAAFVTPNGNILLGGVSNFVSSDNGVTWHEPQFINTWGNKYPIWCAASGPTGTVFAGAQAGVFKSADNGFTFDTTAALPAGVQSICVNAAGHLFIAVYGSVVYRSTNNGDSWHLRSNGITDNPIRAVVCNKKNGDLYAASHYGKLYRSTDNGAQWTVVHTSPTGFNGEVLAIDTTGTIFGGSYSCVVRSTNNGASWDTLLNGFRGKFVRTMIVSPRNWVFAATETGVYMSSDNGLSWHQKNNGVNIAFVNALARTAAGYVFAATEHAGTYRTTDNGATWTKMPVTDASNYCVMVAPNGYIYSGTYTDWWHEGGIFRSTDNGASWLRVEAQNSTITALGYNALGHLFAGTVGVIYRSMDNGLSWQRINESIGGYPHCILQHPSGIMYMSTDFSVYKSTDNGVTWTQTGTFGTDTPYLRRLAFLPDGSIVVCGRGLWRSTDQGGSWTSIPVPDQFIFGLLATPAGDLYIGTQDKGVFHSSGNFSVWTPWHSGLRISQVNELMLDPQGYIWGATNGRSVFKTRNTITEVDEGSTLPGDFALYQNFPNPFNPVTSIKYRTSSPALLLRKEKGAESPSPFEGEGFRVRLVVYDILGRETVTLVNQEQAPGEYTVQFDASRIPSGTYFFELRAGDFRAVKKMVFLK